MRIALISDTQFDSYESRSTFLPSGITSRLNDCVQAVTWAIDDAVRRKCEQLFLLGDIFDSRTVIELPVLDRVCRLMQYASKKFDVVIVLAGNHDSYLRTPLINSLQVFSGLATVVSDQEEVFTANGVDFAFVPWHDDRERFEGMVEAAATALSNPGYLFSHCLVQGAVTASDKGIPSKSLRPQAFKRVILGDVHDPRDIPPNISYVGAPLQLHYGDAGGVRGYRVLDTADNSLKHIENPMSPRFHVVRNPGDVTAAKPSDYVRVEIEDIEAAKTAVERARKVTSWVESRTVETPDVNPRIRIRSGDSHEDAIRRYAEFKGCDIPEVIKAGIDILDEATI